MAGLHGQLLDDILKGWQRVTALTAYRLERAFPYIKAEGLLSVEKDAAFRQKQLQRLIELRAAEKENVAQPKAQNIDASPHRPGQSSPDPEPLVNG